jgi:hypothetical protein
MAGIDSLLEVIQHEDARLEAQGAARFHGLLGEAVLAVWCDIDPEHDAEFNDWYTHQHLPERVGIPGFLRGRRWSISCRLR